MYIHTYVHIINSYGREHTDAFQLINAVYSIFFLDVLDPQHVFCGDGEKEGLDSPLLVTE